MKQFFGPVSLGPAWTRRGPGIPHPVEVIETKCKFARVIQTRPQDLIDVQASIQARTSPGLRQDQGSCRKWAALLTTDWAQVCQARLVPLVVLRRVVCNRVRRLRTGLIQRCDDRFALRAAFLPTRLLAFSVLAGKVYTVVVHHAKTPRAHGKGRETCQICAPCREKSRAHGTSSMPKVVPARQGRAARAPPTLTIPNQTTQQKSGLLGIPE